MLHKFGLVSLLTVSLLGNVTVASAFSPAPVNAVSPVAKDLVQASFWGRPYPYGYTGWARCTRYVETHSGTHLRRVRVCR
jgi:hypothetical protein